jgi:hypothetical protein
MGESGPFTEDVLLREMHRHVLFVCLCSYTVQSINKAGAPSRHCLRCKEMMFRCGFQPGILAAPEARCVDGGCTQGGAVLWSPRS